MPQPHDRSGRLSGTTIALHWIIALGMISMILLGWYCDWLDRGPERSRVLDVHKSIGLSVFALAILRIAWRYKNGFPAALARTPRWQRTGALFTHYALLASTIIMPISGIVQTVTATLPVRFFGYELIPQVFSHRDEARLAHDVAEAIHIIGGFVFAACILVHVAAAFRHHFVNADDTLRRMLGADVTRPRES